MRPLVGILLANLGTPNNYNFISMRNYLAEFLSDKRIIELNKLLWYPILYGIILNSRPKKSGANYKNIWNSKGPGTGSPLLYYTKQQTKKLKEILKEEYSNNLNIKVSFGMRYGQPNLSKAIEELSLYGCENIIILPLFPQYSATTTASIFDACFKKFMKMRNVPSIKTIKGFANNPKYIEALANSINTHLKTLNFTPERILASFHGIPKSYCDKGDPYYQECKKTFDALQNYMQDDRLVLCFQSRFGKAEWLKPYTMDLVKTLPSQDITKIAIFNPGFLSDCLETIDEIGREMHDEFMYYGGKNFSHIPCLNDSNATIELLSDICKKELNNF